MSYNGARRKTVGNRNANHQSSETNAKSKKYFAQNSGGDSWSNRALRPNSDDGREPSNYNYDDGWSTNDRKPTYYTSDDIWGGLPSQPAATENAWEKRNHKKNQKFYADEAKKPVPLVGPNFSWNDEEYPALESRLPVENVWVKRKEKLEGRKAMEPTNQTEEELMIQKAIELSKREAKEEEERRRLIEEEYELQNVILATNPQLFSEFLTPDELVEANKPLEPETTESQSNDLTNGYVEKQCTWDYSKSVESLQKQNKKAGKKIKRNKSQTHIENEVNTQNPWSDSQEFDHNIQNESILSEETEYLEIQNNWSENSASKNFHDKAEENESQFENEGSDYPTEQASSTVLPESDGESKTLKVSQPKISKVIDMFGGWGSKNNRSSLKSSYKQERFESYNYHSSDNDKISQENWEKAKEMSEFDDNLQFHSSKHKEVEIFSKNEIPIQMPLNEDIWNNKHSLNDEQYGNEMKHSLYNIGSNIAATSSFYNAAANSNAGASYLSKKSVPNDEDMNNIVKDYASLAIECTNSSSEKIAVQSKATDIFNSVVTLLNEDNLKSDIVDLHHSNESETQNSSIPVSNQTAKGEIMYTLNNTTPAEFSTKAPNENNPGSWNTKIGFPTNFEKNGIKDNLFLPHINGSVQKICNDHESNSSDPIVPPPAQCETNFPCQPNSVMPNLINPNLMMSMNPMMMQQQMMMLNNPFFLQQLHQMEMYYRTMSMPFASPFLSMQTPPFNPFLNNLMGNYFNSEQNNNMKPVSEQGVESNSSVPSHSHNFENENQRIIPPKASDAPSVEFENSWLSDLLSEGAAHMDSYIPPPTMPVSNPKQSHPALNVESKVDVSISQDISQSLYGVKTIPFYSECDIKSPKKENSALKYGRANVTDGTPKSSMPDAVEASGWGDIDDMPIKNSNSWNDEVDGWADEKVTNSKSMIRSSIYAARKQATTRQPIRQPRQNSQWS